MLGCLVEAEAQATVMNMSAARSDSIDSMDGFLTWERAVPAET